MSILLSTADRAVAAYLSAAMGGSAIAIYPFKRSGEKALPCVIVNCHTGTPISPHDPTCNIECAVLVRTIGPADVEESETDPVDESDRIVGLVDSALRRFGDDEQSGTSFANEINSAALGAGIANFTCLDVELVRYQTDHDMQHDGDAWTDTINLRLTANLTAGG